MWALLTLTIGVWGICSLIKTSYLVLGKPLMALAKLAAKLCILLICIALVIGLPIHEILMVLAGGIAVYQWRRYNKQIAYQRATAAEQAERNEQELKLQILISYLENLDVHYYNYEKTEFARWLLTRAMLDEFIAWDDATRLARLGDVTEKHYVCLLNEMSDSQKKDRAEAAWKKRCKEQSSIQLMKNAAEKMARKGATMG